MAQRGGNFGGQPNMQQLMKQAQKMQQQLEAAQLELASTEVTGTAGGGLVTATMLGSGELTSLTIDPSAVDRLFSANYRQHNPQIPTGPAAIKAPLGNLSRDFKYEPGLVMADGDYVSIHGRYTGWRLPPEQHRYARAKNLLV